MDHAAPLHALYLSAGPSLEAVQNTFPKETWHIEVAQDTFQLDDFHKTSGASYSPNVILIGASIIDVAKRRDMAWQDVILRAHELFPDAPFLQVGTSDVCEATMKAAADYKRDHGVHILTFTGIEPLKNLRELPALMKRFYQEVSKSRVNGNGEIQHGRLRERERY